MLIIVLIINMLVALLCLYLAWQVGKVRRRLAHVADLLFEVEQSTDKALHRATATIPKGQVGTKQLRHRYQELDLQLQRVRQVLALLVWGKRFWLRGGSKGTQRSRQRKSTPSS